MIWLSLAIVILMGVMLASEHAKMRKDLNEAFNEGYRYGKQHAEAKARAGLETAYSQLSDSLVEKKRTEPRCNGTVH